VVVLGRGGARSWWCSVVVPGLVPGCGGRAVVLAVPDWPHDPNAPRHLAVPSGSHRNVRTATTSAPRPQATSASRTRSVPP